MPDISRLVIEVDSKGVVTATGNMAAFEAMSKKVGKGADDLGKKFGAFQLIVNKLPGPLQSVAAGLMGMMTPATAAVSVFLQLGEAAIKFVKESTEAFAKFETLKTNLEVVSSSADEAANTFKELQQFSGGTSFKIDQISEVAVMLRQANTAAEDLIPTLTSLGNLAGGSSERFGRLALNYAQIAQTGKATSMDMRQFMLAGVPIEKMLADIGKAGSTAYEDIAEAIRVATTAGGQFDSAMAKGAQTIQGMKSQIEGLKEQYKALQAEYYNMPKASRAWNEAQISHYTHMIDLMNDKIELQKIEEKEDSGISTYIDDYDKAIILVKQLTSEIDALNSSHEMMASSEGMTGLYEYTRIKQAEKQLEIQNRIISRYQPMIDAHKEMVRQQEQFNRLLSAAETEYRNLQDRIRTDNARTAEARLRELEENIRFYENLLVNPVHKVRVSDQSYRGSELVESNVRMETQRLPENNIRDARENLAMFRRELENLNNGTRRTRDNFDDWVKILSNATGYTNEMVRSLGDFNTGDFNTVEKFSTEINNLIERMTKDGGFLYKILGLNNTDLYEEAADKMRGVVAAMTESGIWDFGDASYIRAIESLKQFDGNAMTKRGENYLADLTKELDNANKSTYELSVRRLMIEKNITEEAARQSVELQQQIYYIKNGYDLMGTVTERMEDALRKIRSGEGGYGEYAANAIGKSAIEFVQGTDVGNFAEGTAMGGPLVGLINMLIDAITNVLNSIDGIDEILSSATAMLMELKDVFKALLLPVLITARLLVLLAKGINWLLNIITFGLIDQMARAYDSLTATNDERDREEERLRALNDQYQKLYDALKLQEEYYLQQRRSLNTEWTIENFQNTRQVNDMILSPHGAFSTDPQDYIIATKHPERLMGGNSSQVFITVNNNAGANITTEESTDADGAKLIQITVNSFVRQGFLNGDYDNILDAVSHRRAGKRVVHV